MTDHTGQTITTTVTADLYVSADDTALYVAYSPTWYTVHPITLAALPLLADNVIHVGLNLNETTPRSPMPADSRKIGTYDYRTVQAANTGGLYHQFTRIGGTHNER